MPKILLVDNGSIRAEATKQLRQLAQNLGEQTGSKIHPVSLRHADKISAELLDGKKAQIFQPIMHEYLERGKRHFIILPLFFGESNAIASQILNHLKSLQLVFTDKVSKDQLK
jgi:sirohydrochlorin ferrochelatase